MVFTTCVTLRLSLAVLPSGGTVTVSVLVPVAVGVKPAKLTVAEAPTASVARVWVLAKALAPVTVSVTGRLARAVVPLLVTTARTTWGAPCGMGSWVSVCTARTAASLATGAAKR